MTCPGTVMDPYIVEVPRLVRWLKECLASANPKCRFCDGTGKQECPLCDGMGHTECVCAECGDKHDRKCEECQGSGELRCTCEAADDPDFRVELCGRTLEFSQTRQLLEALSGVPGDLAHVWASLDSACVHVEELTGRRNRMGHVCVGTRPDWRPVLSRYPVEQPPLPFVYRSTGTAAVDSRKKRGKA